MSNKAIDIEGLKRFKTKQDTFNEGKFVQSADYVDGDGIIKTEKLRTKSPTWREKFTSTWRRQAKICTFTTRTPANLRTLWRMLQAPPTLILSSIKK